MKVPGTKPHISPPTRVSWSAGWRHLLGRSTHTSSHLLWSFVLCQSGRRFTMPMTASFFLLTHTSFHLRGVWIYFVVYYFKSAIAISAQASEFDPMDPEPFERMVDDISEQLNLMVMMIRRSQIQNSYLNPGLSNCHLTFEMPGTWEEDRNVFSSMFCSFIQQICIQKLSTNKWHKFCIINPNMFQSHYLVWSIFLSQISKKSLNFLWC